MNEHAIDRPKWNVSGSPSPPSISRHSSNARIRSSKHASANSIRRARSPPASDDQSLTSFPSLSPSGASSPKDKPDDTRSLSVESQDAAAKFHDEQTLSPMARQGLFAFEVEDDSRSALFDDAHESDGNLPGTLHHQSDEQVSHLIARVGAVDLIKQMARDLAQRDAEVIIIQRRAEEREHLLRRMLRECELSNLEIENRLRELESNSHKRKLGAGMEINNTSPSQRISSGATIEDTLTSRVSEACEDVLGINPAHADSQPIHDFQESTKYSGTAEAQIKRTNDHGFNTQSTTPSTLTHSNISRGWKDLFRTSQKVQRPSASVNGGSAHGRSAQQQLADVVNSNDFGKPRKSLHSDLFRPPSGAIKANVAGKDPIHPQNTDLANSSESLSATSSGSVASWALRFVNGNPEAQGESRDTSSTVKKVERDGERLEHRAKALHSKKPKSVSVQAATQAHLGRRQDHAHADSGQRIASQPNMQSPRNSVSSADVNLGPVEMDTILPDESRPPTLAQGDASERENDLLTDRFGFIYDRKRTVQHNKGTFSPAKVGPNSRIETLENYRRPSSPNDFGNDDLPHAESKQNKQDIQHSDEAALASGRDNSQSQKKWQDYLKVSRSSTELLSDTPTAAVSGEGPSSNIDFDLTSRLPPIVLSKGSSVPMFHTRPMALPARVSSENAALAQPVQAGRTDFVGPSASNKDPVKSLLDQLTEVHDSLQRDKETKWNEFLRKVRAERQRTGELSHSSDPRSKTPFMPETLLADGEMIGVAGLGNKGKVGRAKWNEFRSLVLGGIPVTYRAKIWAECSGASSLRIPGYYEELTNGPIDDPAILQQIQMDIPRTMTDNVFFRNGQGVHKLSEVLLAYARRNPVIGYCQGMNLITANLLLILPTAEDAFWLLTSMVEHILPEKYYDSSLLTSRADQSVLRGYVAEILPQLSSHLDDLGIELEALTFQWFLSVFTDCLSAEALFRVWDVVLCFNDGATFLFQVALALLKLNERQLIACPGPADVYAYINQQMTDHAISIDGLIRASDALRKVVKSEDILQRRAEAVEREAQAEQVRESIRKERGTSKSSRKHEGGVVDSARGKTIASEVSTRGQVDKSDRSLEDLQIRVPMPIDDHISAK